MKNTNRKNIQYEPGLPQSGSEIPLCEPEIRGNEWKYIKECLDTKWVSSAGPYVDLFEERFSEFIGTNFAVATVNGTAALHIALIVSGIQKNDEVIVSSLTFIAPANAIRYVGAWPVFIDSDPNFWQMDVQKLHNFLENGCIWRSGELINRKTNRRVKAILPVHILGHPVDFDPIVELAEEYKLTIIEDSTESLGAKYKGKQVGSMGDISCFSFNGNKLITTGGGGMITTNRSDWAEKAKYLTTQAKDDPLEYIHKEIGFNYRLTNIQAAMGVAQLENIDEYITKKREIAQTYNQEFNKIRGINIMPEASWATSVFWLYTILIDQDKYGISSRKLIKLLSNRKIQSRPLWQPLHISPAHGNGFALNCDTSNEIHKKAISLPCSVGIELDSQEKVIKAISDIAK